MAATQASIGGRGDRALGRDYAISGSIGPQNYGQNGRLQMMISVLTDFFLDLRTTGCETPDIAGS
jgi:hypothetical protein